MQSLSSRSPQSSSHKVALRTKASRRRAIAVAMALVPVSGLIAQTAKAANDTEYDVINGDTDLTSAATYTTGGPTTTGGGTAASAAPTTTSDVTFDSSVSYSPSTFTDNNTTLLSVASVNDLSATTITIQNNATSAQLEFFAATNVVSTSGTYGGNASDVLFVASASTLNIGGGSGNLTLNDGSAANRYDVAGTLNISAPIDIINTKGLTFTGAGSTTISGNIFSTTSVGGSTAGTPGTFTDNSTGTVTLSGANTVTKALTINGGILSTGSGGTLANGGTASSIGQQTNVAASLVLNGGTLQYANTTGGASTDHLFTIGSTLAGGTGTLDASGAGSLNFTNTGAVAYGTNNQTRTLNLTGTNTGANTLSPVIGNNGTGAVSLAKSGVGAWTLNALNTYSGGTTVNQGTLTVDATTNTNAALSGTTAVSVSGSGSVFHLLSSTNTTAAGTGTVTLINPGASVSIDGASNGQLALDLGGNIQPVTSFVIAVVTQANDVYGSATFFADNPAYADANNAADVQYFTGDGAIATPEPGSLSLLALGGLGLMRRRRKQAAGTPATA